MALSHSDCDTSNHLTPTRHRTTANEALQMALIEKNYTDHPPRAGEGSTPNSSSGLGSSAVACGPPMETTVGIASPAEARVAS